MQQNPNIYDIYISVGYLSFQIEKHIKKYRQTEINIYIIKEDIPLGTAGPLSLLKNVDDDLIVINGDILTDVNFKDFYQFYNKNDSLVTILTIPLTTSIPFGVLTVNENQNITMIEEKPKIKNYISGGCYIFNKEIIKKVPKNKNLKMTDFLEKLINDNISISSYVHNGVWIDAGTWEDLKKAKSIFL